jgi:hypothetical protein
MAVAEATAGFPSPRFPLGRTFVGPWFDALVIGGGLSLVATAILVVRADARALIEPHTLVYPATLLVCQYAHFAASTMRLYTREGASERWPFLTMGFPLLTFGLVALAIWQAELLGRHVTALFLTWSPYHYAAQSYGLSLMYAYRSGCRISPRQKRVWWGVALCPFLLNFMGAPHVGLQWLVPIEWIQQSDLLRPTVYYGLYLLQALTLIGPIALFAWFRRGAAPMPLMSLLILMSNGIWFVFLTPMDAFFVATAGHGLQYLAITTIFHVKDGTARPGNTRSGWWYGVTFYGACVALGYALFSVTPLGFFAASGRWSASLMMVLAAINLHHFIVDGFIWKLSGGDKNRRVVESGGSAA